MFFITRFLTVPSFPMYYISRGIVGGDKNRRGNDFAASKHSTKLLSRNFHINFFSKIFLSNSPRSQTRESVTKTKSVSMEKVFSISRHFGMSSDFMDFFFGLFAFIALFEFHLKHYEIICSEKSIL
jgi:hypothetical protein